ncbi:MAG TPA: SDR family NAD(P)-dependent oxidoreductase [Acidimicrobiales bacterium]|jgi:NAD(P)-dependent dehydrogenase (short-subunit alcohol dehydrogenase family)
MDRKRFDGKAVMVTGAANGIGREIASAFALEGARVSLVDRDGEALETAVGELADKGFDVFGVHADLSSADECRRAVDQTAERFGRFDVLVNNAGGSAYTSLHIEEVSEEDFDRVIGWNVKSTYFCIKAALPHFRAAGGGAVVNMGAIAGRAGTELLPPQYSAAKAGVIGLTRNLARHLGPEGIRVNIVSPGFIRSGARVEAIWNTRENPAEVLAQIPLRRRGEMSEIADAVMFLAGEESSYVTGAVIDVNGGFFCV